MKVMQESGGNTTTIDVQNLWFQVLPLCIASEARFTGGGGSGVVITLGSQSREPGFESSCCLLIFFGNFVHPTLPQFNQLYKRVPGYRGGYVNGQFLRSNCNMAEYYPEK